MVKFLIGGTDAFEQRTLSRLSRLKTLRILSVPDLPQHWTCEQPSQIQRHKSYELFLNNFAKDIFEQLARYALESGTTTLVKVLAFLPRERSCYLCNDQQVAVRFNGPCFSRGQLVASHGTFVNVAVPFSNDEWKYIVPESDILDDIR